MLDQIPETTNNVEGKITWLMEKFWLGRQEALEINGNHALSMAT